MPAATPTVANLTWFDRSARVRLEVAGPDRAKFLHNLTTNDVKRLRPAHGQEAFVTSPQGKTLAYVTLLATDDAIVVRSDAGTADSFVPHLRKYGVFDDVTITDRSAETAEFHLVGPGAGAWIADLGIDPAGSTQALQLAEVVMGGRLLQIVREDLVGEPGWTIIGPIAATEAIRARLAAAEARPGDEATFEVARIEAGTPVSGRDVQAGNLPQEVGRDDRTINFVKGCYLGQETVARLDALGHVNRIFTGGVIEGTAEVPPPGTPLLGEDGKAVGTITSSAFAPGRDATVFLGYVRVAQAVAGTRLALGGETGSGMAVVLGLPIPR